MKHTDTEQEMKKAEVKKRNPYVAIAMKMSGAGNHRKPNKAKRKAEKQKGWE